MHPSFVHLYAMSHHTYPVLSKQVGHIPYAQYVRKQKGGMRVCTYRLPLESKYSHIEVQRLIDGGSRVLDRFILYSENHASHVDRGA